MTSLHALGSSGGVHGDPATNPALTVGRSYTSIDGETLL